MLDLYAFRSQSKCVITRIEFFIIFDIEMLVCFRICIRLLFFFFSFAVVTGATDGIGKSYAKHLAKQGKNIILISRNQSRLERVAAEIGEICI